MAIARHRPVSAAAAVLLICLLPATARPQPAADDTWPRYAHDAALTGRTTLKGDIAQPRRAWSVSLAGSLLEVELRPATGRHALRLPGSTAAVERTIAVPGRPSMRDLDGSGLPRPAVETHHQRWAKVLPDVRGLQRVGWDQTWTTAEVCHLELFAYDEGYDRPRRVWQSQPEGTVFMPLCIVDDIDGDGVREICVALHYRVMIYEGTTGRKESELKFHSSRSYGWFGLADVDADGQRELVVLSDFQSHLDVLDFDPARPESERLSVRWRRDIEQAIERRAKWPRIGPRPVVDVTGDGKPEIVINLYNDTGDGQWHTVVLDARNGKTLVDLPNRFTQGNADIDGDGDAEIFCATTNGTLVPTCGHIEIVRADAGAVSVLWSQDNAGFAMANLPHLGALWSTGASMGMRHVLLTGQPIRPAFLVLSLAADAEKGDTTAGAGQTVSLTALQHDGQTGVKRLWQVDGLKGDLETVAVAGNDRTTVSAVVRMKLPARFETTLAAEGAAPLVVGRRSLGTGPFAPIATRVRPGGPMHLFVEGAGAHFYAILPPAGNRQKAEIAWQRPGRGMGSDSTRDGLMAADLNGDGRSEVVAVDAAASGAAVLAAYHADGQPYWRRTFDEIPGGHPVHNSGALTYWWPGRFRSTEQIDLFVNTRRGLMHSDVGHLVDGRTGRHVWSRDKAFVPNKFHWGYAGMPIGIADVVGDPRDELVNLYPVCYWAADGATGQIVEAQELASRKVVPAWAAYGEPIIHDFTGDGSKEILLDSVYILALLDSNGTPLWHGKRRRDYPTGKADDNIGETTSTKHALVDFDGDGRVEIASGGYRDGVRAIDPSDGTVLWSLEAPAPTGRKCAAANIDGVGGDELLYVAGDRLVAVTGDRQGGRVLWIWQGPAPLSMPAIADIDGDGQAEIVVQSADGVVHCIDGPAITAAHTLTTAEAPRYAILRVNNHLQSRWLEEAP